MERVRVRILAIITVALISSASFIPQSYEARAASYRYWDGYTTSDQAKYGPFGKLTGSWTSSYGEADVVALRAHSAWVGTARGGATGTYVEIKHARQDTMSSCWWTLLYGKKDGSRWKIRGGYFK